MEADKAQQINDEPRKLAVSTPRTYMLNPCNARLKADADSYRSGVFRNAGFDRRHTQKRITIGPDDWNVKCNHIADSIGKGVMIALTGKRGTGKTQMVSEAVARYLDGIGDLTLAGACVPSGPGAVYLRAIGIFIAIRASYGKKSEETEGDVIKRYCRPGLLIIDEMHDRGETEWEDRMLTHIIDVRYGAMKDTVMISNQTKDEFLKQVGSSISSRLAETGGVMECDWDSFRGKQ